MVHIARLFYEDELTKLDIARRERMESRKVAAILREARMQGIVRILINAKETEHTGLATKIKNRFGLREVFIVPAAPESMQPANRYDDFLQRAAPVGAELLDRLVDGHQKAHPKQRYRIGLTGGETLLEFVLACPDRMRMNVHFYATAIVPHREIKEMSASHVDPSTNCTIAWARSGRFPGFCHYTTMTPYEITGTAREALDSIRQHLKSLEADNSKIRAAISAMQTLDAVFVGLGTFTVPRSADQAFKDRLTMLAALDPEITLNHLKTEHFVGDISYCPIKADGTSDPDWQFFFTAGYGTAHQGVDFYRHMTEQKRPVVAIAGPYKLDPILAALRGKLVNHLITDEITAAAIAKARVRTR
jgi:DNA-binding transcriptional regulator LsrR (DeoR family)